MIQLTRRGLLLSGGAAETAARQAEFQNQHCLRLPGFIEPTLLEWIADGLASAPFEKRLAQDGSEIEEKLSDGALKTALLFILNNPELFSWVEQVAGVQPVRCFAGRVYRRADQPGHYFDWHDDTGMDRLVALSINLTRKPYQGGLLQMRLKADQQPVAEIANTGFGDAMLFRVAPFLEHRVTPVEGPQARITLAGWFSASPHYRELFGWRSI